MEEMSSTRLRKDASNPSAQNPIIGETCFSGFIGISLSSSAAMNNGGGSWNEAGFRAVCPFAGVDRSEDMCDAPQRLDVSDMEDSESS